MGFWSDSSMIVKIVIIVGGLGIIVSALVWGGVFDGEGAGEDIGQTRGISAPE